MIIEELPLVLFGVQEQPRTLSVPSNSGSQFRIVQNRREVIEPIQFGGGRVKAQKVVGEAMKSSGFQVVHRLLKLRHLKGPKTPGFPGEAATAIRRFCVINMKDTAIKRGFLHFRD